MVYLVVFRVYMGDIPRPFHRLELDTDFVEIVNVLLDVQYDRTGRHTVHIREASPVPSPVTLSLFCQVPPLLATVPRNPDGPRQIHRFPYFLLSDFSLVGQRLPVGSPPAPEEGETIAIQKTFRKHGNLLLPLEACHALYLLPYDTRHIFLPPPIAFFF